MDNSSTELLQDLANMQSQSVRVTEKMTDFVTTQSILLGLVALELGLPEEKLAQLLEKAKTETNRISLILRDDLSDAA